MSADAPTLTRLRDLATSLRDDLGLRGRWRWMGNFDEQQLLALNGAPA